MTTDDVIAGILQREGWPKITNDRSDLGGLTKGGVTLQALSRFRGRRVVPQELLDLTEADARALYRQSYIVDPGFRAITPLPLQAFIVDYAVHSGVVQAVSDVQRGIGGLTVDGVFGPATLAALAHVDAHRLLVTLIRTRSQYLHHLALRDSDVLAFLDAHPTAQLHNLNGWNNRILEFVS